MAQTDTTSLKPLFVVETPPYIHRGVTIHGMMRDTVLALLPAMALALMAHGVAAFRVMALAAGVSVLAEAVCVRLAGQKLRIEDGTALISGLLLAFMLPVQAPWWLVTAGAVLAMVLGKHVFGGLGANPLCTPLVGWACLYISWPKYMNPTAMVLNTDFIDPLMRLKFFGTQSISPETYKALLMGEQLGGLGSVYVGAVLLGGLFLVARRAVRWEIPVTYLLTVYALGFLLWTIDPARYIAPELYLLTGSTVFAAFFLATDHPSSPFSIWGIALFGVLAGAMTVLIRAYGIHLDGAPFAILLANLFTPLLDMIRPVPWGGRK